MGTGIYKLLMAGMAVLAIAPIAAVLTGRSRRVAGWVSFLFCLAAGALLAWAGLEALLGDAPVESALVDLGLGKLHFLVDGLSAVFLLLISVIATVAAFYSIRYMEHYSQYSARGYYVSYPLFVLGMIGIATADDLTVGFSIAWQLMTIASFFLIRYDHQDSKNVRIANRYLALMELAWILILAGAYLIPGAALGDSLPALTQKLGQAEGGLRAAVYALLLLGFAFKAGVFPLGQLWLPDAHSVAPSPVSAVLSGVMIKTGVFGIVRTLFWMLPAGTAAFEGQALGLVVATAGTVTLFIGTSQALKQNDAKRLHAYSSIGQMGYIVLAIGAALYFHFSESEYLKTLSVIALLGAIYHTVNHAVFKALLFLSTGSVQYATGRKDLSRLGGLIKLMPLTTLVAAIAAGAVAGVPAFSGFMSKWAIVSASLLAGREAVVFSLFGVVALMTSAMTLATYVKFFGLAFTASGIEWNAKKQVKEVPWLMLAPKAVLTVVCVLQGLLPFVFFGGLIQAFLRSEGFLAHEHLAGSMASGAIVSSGAGISILLPGAQAVTAVAMPVALALIFAAGFALAQWLRKAGDAPERTSAVWLCGYQQLNGANRYGSEGMYAAFKSFTKWTGGNAK